MTLPENQVLPEEQMVYIDRYKQMDEEAKAKEKETTPTPDKKGLIENKRLIAIMSSIALLVVIGGYTANKIFNKNQPVATEIEIPTIPVETPQAIVEATPTTTPENSTDQYKPVMEKYKEMNVDEFEKLKLDERLLYSQYLIDKSNSTDVYNANYYGHNTANESFGVSYTPVNEGNNGQQIVNNFVHTIQISYLQNKIVGDPTKVGFNNFTSYDSDSGEKVLSSAFYKVGDNNSATGLYTYTTTKTQEESLPKHGSINTKFTATNTSKLLDGTDKNSESIKYKTITYFTGSGETHTNRFILHNFTSYNGSRESVWLLDNTTVILNTQQ